MYQNDKSIEIKLRDCKDEKEYKKLLDDLIIDNIPLTKYIIKKYFLVQFPFMKMEDLIDLGYIALVNAAKKFDFNNGIKFSTYASKCVYNIILRHCQKELKKPLIISLDKPIKIDDKEVPWIERIKDDTDSFLESRVVRAFNEIFNSLTEKDKVIITLYINDKNQKEIGEECNLSQSYVSRKIKKFKNKFYKLL